MLQATKIKTKIISSGSFLPDEVVLSDDLLDEIKSESQYGIPRDYISKTIGIIERRVCEPGTKPSELAIKAAEQALAENAEVDPDEIGLVIFCGIVRDHPEPSTAFTVVEALGLKPRYAFDVANACYGFVDAVHIASSYIRHGDVKQALIVTGEVSSKPMWEFTRQLKNGMPKRDAMLRLGALTVGDAGGAMVLGPSFGYDAPGIEYMRNSIDSSHIAKCTYEIMPDGTMDGCMDMAKLGVTNLRMHENMIGDTMTSVGWDKFDWVLTHQIGARFFNRLKDLTGATPNKMIKTFDTLGNITTATLPVCYQKLVDGGKVASGDRIGGCFAGSGLIAGQFGYTI